MSLCVFVCAWSWCLFGERVALSTFVMNLGYVSYWAKHSFNPLNHPVRLWGSNLHFTDEEVEAQWDCNQLSHDRTAVKWKTFEPGSTDLVSETLHLTPALVLETQAAFSGECITFKYRRSTCIVSKE